MIQNLHRVIDLIDRGWGAVHVLVIGDVMLDSYIWGEVERISPEAPVPIVKEVHRTERPGGAANVAMNLAGVGARASLFGFCGDDAHAVSLKKLLSEANVKAHLTEVSGYPTTAKQRILSGKQQMMRLDTERTEGYPLEAYERLLQQVRDALSSADAVVLSDYAKGVLSEDFCGQVISLARKRQVPILVDPKQRNFARYRRATAICPNLNELAIATNMSAKDIEALLNSGESLAAELGIDWLVATMSEKGIAVLREGSRFLAPAAARQVFDVSGAGDTVIAILALTLGSGLDLETGAQLANIAAGVVVSRIGTVAVTRDELLASLRPEIELDAREKVLTLEHLKSRASSWHLAGERIVFTNGCFDLLHIGHITLLEAARREGDRLIVAINSDASVKRLKGPTRPVVGEGERARIVASLAAVDAVVLFDEPTPLRLIENLRPEVIVKGGDYQESTVVGAREVLSWGGTVKIVPTVEGFSTTNLIAQAFTVNSKVGQVNSSIDLSELGAKSEG